ncbi:hypothetical protein AN958_02102 [Leucoagaricus sp. SymC.cos]|nr:hypothetical protein AN958_02102 [Leucoagaricus sp. SymC.cos]
MDISLHELQPGDRIIAIMGPPGIGKSTVSTFSPRSPCHELRTLIARIGCDRANIFKFIDALCDQPGTRVEHSLCWPPTGFHATVVPGYGNSDTPRVVVIEANVVGLSETRYWIEQALARDVDFAGIVYLYRPDYYRPDLVKLRQLIILSAHKLSIFTSRIVVASSGGEQESDVCRAILSGGGRLMSMKYSANAKLIVDSILAEEEQQRRKAGRNGLLEFLLKEALGREIGFEKAQKMIEQQKLRQSHNQPLPTSSPKVTFAERVRVLVFGPSGREEGQNIQPSRQSGHTPESFSGLESEKAKASTLSMNSEGIRETKAVPSPPTPAINLGSSRGRLPDGSVQPSRTYTSIGSRNSNEVKIIPPPLYNPSISERRSKNDRFEEPHIEASTQSDAALGKDDGVEPGSLHEVSKGDDEAKSVPFLRPSLSNSGSPSKIFLNATFQQSSNYSTDTSTQSQQVLIGCDDETKTLPSQITINGFEESRTLIMRFLRNFIRRDQIANLEGDDAQCIVDFLDQVNIKPAEFSTVSLLHYSFSLVIKTFRQMREILALDPD